MKTPTSAPGTPRSLATAGATAGSEYAAIVASACVASIASSGQSGKRVGDAPVIDAPGSGRVGGGAAGRELAGVADVRHRSPLHVALPAQLVVVGAAMQGATVVPHDEIVQTPAMGIDELPLRRVRHQLVEQPGRFVLGQADHAHGVRGGVQRAAA